MSDSDTLGGVVRRRRLESGYSLGQLASKVGKTAAEVRAWERDSELPEHGILERLAETLELDLADIQSRVAAAQSAATKGGAKKGKAAAAKAPAAKKKPASAAAKKSGAAKEQAPDTDEDTAKEGGEPATDDVNKPAPKKKPGAKRKKPPAKTKKAAGAGAVATAADKVAEADRGDEADKAAEADSGKANAEVKKPAAKKKPAQKKKPAAQERKTGAAAAAGSAAVAGAAAGVAGAAAGSAPETAGKAVAAAGAGAPKTTDAKASKPAPKKKPSAKRSKTVDAEEPVEQGKAAPDEGARTKKPDEAEPPDPFGAEILEEPDEENLPGFAVDDPFAPPPVEEVDPGLLDAPTEAVPVPVITETAAAARAQRAAAVIEEPAPPPPLPTVEPAPDADPGLLRYLEPLRLLYDPQSRSLYWIRGVLTVVVMMILAVVFFRMLGNLLDAISQLLDTIEPSAPSPDDLDALGVIRRVLV